MSTPLEAWLEKVSLNIGLLPDEQEQAIAVIEKLKEALEQIETNNYVHFERKEITKAALAIDPSEKL